MKNSVRNLTQQHSKAQNSLEEYRKKERIYNLHKRCADESTRRVTQVNKQLMQAKMKLTGATEQNQMLDKVTKESNTSIRIQQKNIMELQKAVEMLTEENKLLRDFTYNVDPNAK